jgi:hypothetical protein
MRGLWTVSCVLLAAACGQDEVGPEPRADAGFDQLVRAGSTVTLDGSASRDPNAAPLVFQWTLVEKPTPSAATLTNAATARPTLNADAVGAYLLTLIVDNGERRSAPDVVVVRAKNVAPVALAQCGAGSLCRVAHGRVATLDARGSYDGDGDATTAAWTQVTDAPSCAQSCPTLVGCNPSATPVAIASATSLLTSFTAPDAEDLTLVFHLWVSDGITAGTTCLVYTTFNTPPVALLATSGGGTNPSSVLEGTTFVVSGSSSGDPDGDGLSYVWEQITGPSASFQSTSAATVQVTAPLIVASPSVTPSETMGLRLTVSDGIDSAVVSLSVVVNNN